SRSLSMSDTNSPPGQSAIQAQPTPHAGPRGKAAVAWLVILSVGAAFVLMQSLGKRKQSAEGDDAAGAYVILELQSRIRVGALQALNEGGKPDPKAKAVLASSSAEYNRGSVGQRFRAIIALGEFDGPKTAKDLLEQLAELAKESGHELT